MFNGFLKISNVIGFFLSLAFSCTSEENGHGIRPCDRQYLDFPALHTTALVILPTFSFFQAGQPAVSASEPNKRMPLLYGGIVFVLVIVSLYLLFYLKRKRVMQNRVDMLETERLVLFDNAPCGYHSVDGDGIVMNMNNTMLRWLGYERDEIVGRKKFTDIVEGDPDQVIEKIVSLDRGSVEKTELILLMKSGEKFPVVMNLMNIQDLAGDSSLRLYSTIDNMKCHEALVRIQTLDQELEDFSYSISHDLRAPLRSINGYSKILQDDYADRLDEEGRRVLNVVMNNARRMGKLIDDLLEFGRLGRKTLQRTQVNMTAIARSIVEELLLQEPNRRIHVNVGELLPASVDTDMIRQVWFNLIENAVKYTGKKDLATIDIRAYLIGNREICYEIRDNGVGFDMQYSGKLFGIFQRLHKMQDFSGTGVGLAIVKRILSRHGGRVWAEASLNKGATFYFTLPTGNENT